MSSDILLKEDEFYKENEKLEQKTKQLLERVNEVMKIQDNLIKDSFKTKQELETVKSMSNANILKSSTNLLMDDVQLSPQELELLNLPQSTNQMGPKAIGHIYRGKFKSLQVEHQKLENEFRSKCDELKKVQKLNQQLQEEKEKWFTSFANNKTTIGKLESQNQSLNNKLQAKDSENLNLKKELENLRKEFKSLQLNFNGMEARLSRSQEETEKLKLNLKSIREEEKELKEQYRRQINDLNAIMKQNEKHKLELINAFKKQSQLIQNLKKQKVQLQGLKAAEVAENEFMKILNVKLD